MAQLTEAQQILRRKYTLIPDICKHVDCNECINIKHCNRNVEDELPLELITTSVDIENEGVDA